MFMMYKVLRLAIILFLYAMQWLIWGYIMQYYTNQNEYVSRFMYFTHIHTYIFFFSFVFFICLVYFSSHTYHHHWWVCTGTQTVLVHNKRDFFFIFFYFISDYGYLRVCIFLYRLSIWHLSHIFTFSFFFFHFSISFLHISCVLVIC